MLQWSSGKLLWEEEENPVAVKKEKSTDLPKLFAESYGNATPCPGRKYFFLKRHSESLYLSESLYVMCHASFRVLMRQFESSCIIPSPHASFRVVRLGLRELVDYVRTLGFEETPDYDSCRSFLKEGFAKTCESQMASGVTVADACKTMFEAIKKDKKHRYAVYFIKDDKEIDVEVIGDRNSVYTDFLKDLQKGGEFECRYGVFDYEYTHQCCPDTAIVKKKMLYSSSFDALKKSLVGVHKCIQATDNAEASEELLQDNEKKRPKRVLHFSDGVLEEYEDDDDEKVDSVCRDVVDPTTLNWLPFFWYYTITFGTKTLNVCDTVGEYLAYFFGITSPKYQYEIEEYKWMKKEAEREEKQEEMELKSWGGGDELSAVATAQPNLESKRCHDEQKLTCLNIYSVVLTSRLLFDVLMAVSAHLRYIFSILLAAVLSYAQISDLRLCSDANCNAQISEARTLLVYHSSDPHILSFQKNIAVKVFSKSAGTNPDLWGAEISGKRGYVPKNFIREQRIIIPLSDLKSIVPTEGSLSKDNSVVQSSWTKSALTRGIETVATFAKEFPASLDQLSTNILKQVFISAETINVEPVSTESIDNVTLHDAVGSIAASKSDLPIVRVTDSVIPRKIVNRRSVDGGKEEIKSHLSQLKCDVVKTEFCTYTFGSVLARFVTSRMEMGIKNEDLSKKNGKINSSGESNVVIGEKKEKPPPEDTSKIESDLNASSLEEEDDVDDDQYSVEDDEQLYSDEDDELESSENEFVQSETPSESIVSTANVEKQIIKQETHFSSSSLSSEESISSGIPVEESISSGIPVEETISSGIPVEESISSGIPVEESISSGIPVKMSISASETEKEMISTSTVEEIESSILYSLEDSISSEVLKNPFKIMISASVTENRMDSTLIKEETVDYEVSSSIEDSITAPESEKQMISSLINEKSVENVVSSSLEDSTHASKVEEEITFRLSNEETTESYLLSSSVDPISDLPAIDEDFSLGKNLQLIIDFLPESVQMVLDDHKKMGVSPHATVLTTITGFFLLLFFTIYLLIKRGNKERNLVARLCKLDRKLFTLTAERDLLKENSEIVAVEHEEKYAKMDETFSIVSEDLVSAKEENDALCSLVDKLQEEISEFKNTSVRLKSDCETKDNYLHELEEQCKVREENYKTLEEQVDDLQEELRLKLEIGSENEQRIASLSEEIDELRQSNSQLLAEAQVWNQSLQESQQEIEIMSKTNLDLVLRDTATQLGSLEAETDSETKSKKLQMLFDVSAVSAQLKATSTEYAALRQDYDAKSKASELVQSRFDEIVAENELLRQRDGELKQERDEAVTKLHVLSDYFKGKEIELQKELGVQEAMRQQTAESALSVTEKAELYEKEVQLNRAHIEALKKEMDNQVRSYKTQITVHESKSHENWLAARAAERRAEEAKQEAAMLRNKLTALEHEAASRVEMPETRLTPTRRDIDSNGQVSSPPPLMGHRIPFLPLDRPLPPPPPRGGMPPPPPHPPFLGDRLSRFDLPPPMMPFDYLPPPGRRPPSPPMFNRRPPFGGPFRDLSPPRFYERANAPHKPSEARFPSPYSGSRVPGSPPSDANTSV
uniref:ADF-H domain-containing protein n=1 Tax=Strigamia maritima TaxID=126957 RepID=T1JGN8_STRMM